jgi:hypothetical protein
MRDKAAPPVDLGEPIAPPLDLDRRAVRFEAEPAAEDRDRHGAAVLPEYLALDVEHEAWATLDRAPIRPPGRPAESVLLR